MADKNKEEELFPLDKKEQINPKQDRYKIVLFILGAFLLAVGLLFLTREKVEEEEEKETPKQVSVLKIGSDRSKKAYVEQSVKIMSENQASVLAEYTGRITQVNFEVGDEVKKGQVLAKFDQSQLENTTVIDLETAQEAVEIAEETLSDIEDAGEASYDAAKEDVKLAKIELEAAKAGNSNMSVEEAERRLDQAKDRKDQIEAQGEQSEDSAEAQLNQAKASLKKANLARQKTIIKAPQSGVVVSKNLSNNDYINQGTLIARISSSDNLEAKLFLSKDIALKLKQGDQFDLVCSLNGYNDAGEIENISPLAESSNLRYALKLKFYEPMLSNHDCLAVNQFVKVKLEVPNLDQTNYYVPLNSVNFGQIKSTVFVIEGDRANKKEVQTGEIFGEYIEITDGLTAGEQLIVVGNKNLRDEDLITVK
jgi:RND family efflux transporter MFP subunit